MSRPKITIMSSTEASPDESIIQVTSHLGSGIISFRAPVDGDALLMAMTPTWTDINVIAHRKVFIRHPEVNGAFILTPTEAVSGLLDALRDLVEAQSDGYAPPDNDPRMKAARRVLKQVEAANPAMVARAKAEREVRHVRLLGRGVTDAN